MRFGIFYEHQIPRPWHDGDEHSLFKEALEQVELADRLGIDYAWEVEHHLLSVWDEFKKAPPFPQMPTGGIGSPDEVRANLEQFEAVGVDQVVFIQQGGRNRHADICSSLELFADRVLPDFQARHEARARRKAEELAPWVARALERMPPLEPMREVPAIDSYPVLIQKTGLDISQLAASPGQHLREGVFAGKPPA